MIFERGTSGWLAHASLNRCIKLSISSSPSARGVTCTLHPVATAKSWLLGSRAAIQIGGGGWWRGVRAGGGGREGDRAPPIPGGPAPPTPTAPPPPPPTPPPP